MRFNYKNSFYLLLACITFLSSCKDEELSTADQYYHEQALIDNYLSENGLTALIDSEYSLRYIINQQGDTSLTAAKQDSMLVTYSVTILKSGKKVVDQANLKLKLDNQVGGWQILMPKLQQGGKMTMFLPSFYGYGAIPVGEIPKNSTLIIEVELHEVLHLTVDEQFAYDQAKIDAFIAKNSETVQMDSVYGLKYAVITEGTGKVATSTSDVTVSYSGYRMDDKTLELHSFDTGARVTFDLADLIDGWKILMPKMKEGGEIRMFIPSKYGYGTNRISVLPSNAVLVFDVKLYSVN